MVVKLTRQQQKHKLKRRPTTRKPIFHIGNDKTLLRSFLGAALLVSISIILVPFDIENNNEDNATIHHGIGAIVNPAPVVVVVETSTTISSKKNSTSKQLYDRLDEQTPPKKLDVTTNTAIEVDHHDTNSTTFYNNKKLHVMVSTGCSTFQDWQSYVFFFHVLKSGQQGHITRIASGCSDENEATLRDIFKKEIEPMAPGRLHIHFTPEYGNVKPELKNFKYFNKPFGVRHWFRNGLGFPDNHREHDDTIFILMDPDQIMLRPFTGDFTNEAEIWKLRKGYKLKVEHGSPFAQMYGYGIQWLRKTNATQVFNGQPTPVATMQFPEAQNYYFAMGPPYIATGKDMYAILETWADIVPRVHNDYPHLLAEMFGYNLAAAHNGIRHTVAKSFMVSDIWSAGEGWRLLKDVSNADMCHNFPKSQYPHVIHYCQRYYIGKWFIGKYRLRKDFISCEAPLLKRPPDDVGVRYTAAIMPDKGERKELKPDTVRQETFVLCAMIDALNEAALYYKDHHCSKEAANYVYNYTFHDDMLMPEEKVDNA